MKKEPKTETIEEYLARGGTIEKLPTKFAEGHPYKGITRQIKRIKPKKGRMK